MAELELEGLHADGEHLVLVGPDGQRFRLLIDDALRAAVRRDRPQLEHLRSAAHPRPRDIQSRIRAGESAEDVARLSDLPVEHVRKYEGPVLAERSWAAEQARAIAIGRESGAPRLGDLVIDRLAARGVPPRTSSGPRSADRARPGNWSSPSLRAAASGRRGGASTSPPALSTRSTTRAGGSPRWSSVGRRPAGTSRRCARACTTWT